MKRLTVSHRLAGIGVLAAMAIATVVPATAFAAPQAGCAGNVQCIIQFGDARITERQTALTKLATAITNEQNKNHLTADQGTDLQGLVTNGQNGMTAIKTKLDAETTATAAREDVKNIYEQYRIFAVVVPSTSHKMWYDILSNVEAKMRALQPKIEARINAAPASEKDQLNTLYSDYKAQLSEAESQLDAAQGQFATLTVSNYNNDRSVYITALTDTKTDLKTAHTDLHTAASDLHQIVQTVKAN